MRIEGAYLLVVALVMLVIPGIVYNNLNNSGLISPVETQVCNQGTDTCTLSVDVGCAVSPANCELAGSDISLFNQQSPFTSLLTGNVFNLFNNVQGPGTGGANSGAQTTPIWGTTHYPFDVTGNSIYVSVNCLGDYPAGGDDQKQWQPFTCTQTATDGDNLSQSQTVHWTNFNTEQSGLTEDADMYQMGNATVAITCSFISQINYTTLSNGPGYTYYGCGLYAQPSFEITTPNWGLLLAMPLGNGAPPMGDSHQFIFAQTENWMPVTPDGACIYGINVGPYTSQGCQNFQDAFHGISIPGVSGSYIPNSATALVAGLLIGLVLLIAGVGLQFGLGAGISVGINAQGTKLVQVIGIGLILYSFFFSEFDTWFTSGWLPYGLDGVIGGVGLCIGALMFAGVYLLSQQGSPINTS